MDATAISLVSACTALLASIAGPIVTLTVARRQFRATVLSANRQRWIESLRDLLAEFTSQVLAVVILKKTWKLGWEDGLVAAAAEQAAGAPGPGIGVQLNQRSERLALIYCKIRLLTNPAEPDHRELCRSIEVLLETLKQPEMPPTAAREAIDLITRQSQAILKHEWERVKRGI